NGRDRTDGLGHANDSRPPRNGGGAGDRRFKRGCPILSRPGRLRLHGGPENALLWPPSFSHTPRRGPMGTKRGRFLPLSLARRMIGDFLRMSQPIPLAHGERRVDLRPLREAVAAVRPRPNWIPIFFKAYAMVAAERPVL